MVDTTLLIKRLHLAQVDFVIIGGVAAIAYGGDVSTEDLDICASLTHENAVRIITAFQDLNPRWFTRPDLPVVTAVDSNLHGLKNMYLRTDLGKVDVLGEVPGVCTYDELLERCVETDFGGYRCRMIDLDTLIEAKRTANRPKDQLSIRYLQVIKKHRENNPGLFKP